MYHQKIVKSENRFLLFFQISKTDFTFFSTSKREKKLFFRLMKYSDLDTCVQWTYGLVTSTVPQQMLLNREFDFTMNMSPYDPIQLYKILKAK